VRYKKNTKGILFSTLSHPPNVIITSCCLNIDVSRFVFVFLCLVLACHHIKNIYFSIVSYVLINVTIFYIYNMNENEKERSYHFLCNHHMLVHIYHNPLAGSCFRFNFNFPFPRPFPTLIGVCRPSFIYFGFLFVFVCHLCVE
jgi:hypothetical protein